MTRKAPGVVADAAAPKSVRCIVRRVHLGDGRVLLDGETAIVTPEVAAILLGNKQVVTA